MAYKEFGVSVYELDSERLKSRVGCCNTKFTQKLHSQRFYSVVALISSIPYFYLFSYLTCGRH